MPINLAVSFFLFMLIFLALAIRNWFEGEPAACALFCYAAYVAGSNVMPWL